jgi:hypothetical protein
LGTARGRQDRPPAARGHPDLEAFGLIVAFFRPSGSGGGRSAEALQIMPIASAACASQTTPDAGSLAVAERFPG